ncbi:amidohydrolase family protein, partial [candidate division WOR-3 bacterium]|nr:amidohydrolase family protein [candidate division WOR-3 bacterium]
MIFDLHIKNAAQIVTMKDRGLGVIEDSDIIIHKGRISKICSRKEAENCRAERVMDASGKVIMPGFIDCHTHLVFAGSRAGEFARRMRGDSYEDIAREGGG